MSEKNNINNIIKHTKITIKYKENKPYLACDECSLYDDTNYLLNWEPHATYQAVEKALQKHNEEINEKSAKILLDVKNNGVIKYLSRNDLWEFSYNYNGDIQKDTFGTLSKEDIEQVWKYTVRKVVALENSKQNDRTK